jgi:hypothetical protein
VTDDDPSDFYVRIPNEYYNTVRHWASRLCKGSPYGSTMDRVRVALEEAADAGTERCAFVKRDDLEALDKVIGCARKTLSPEEDHEGPATPGEIWCSTILDEIFHELRKDAITKLGELG